MSRSPFAFALICAAALCLVQPDVVEAQTPAKRDACTFEIRLARPKPDSRPADGELLLMKIPILTLTEITEARLAGARTGAVSLELSDQGRKQLEMVTSQSVGLLLVGVQGMNIIWRQPILSAHQGPRLTLQLDSTREAETLAGCIQKNARARQGEASKNGFSF